MTSTLSYWAWLRQPLKAFGVRYWHIFTVLIISLITITATFWIVAHPFGTNWDEARYLNRAYRDVAMFQQGGLGALIQALIDEDRSRPPAYRLLVLPFTLIFGASPTLVRLISIGTLWVTLAFIYLAARSIAGAAAGTFAAVFLAICPIIVGPNMRFYVDYPLYLAIAATFYFLFQTWNKERASARSWIGLGLALGLGGLAKPTIVFTVGPAIFIAAFLSWRKIIANPTPASLLKASGLALAVMFPWWIFNWKPAIAKAFLSGGFVRHSVASTNFLDKVHTLLTIFSQSMIGPALTLLSIAIVATLLVKVQLKQLQLDVTQVTAIAACLASAAPLLLMALVKANHNPRLYTPSLLPLAIAIGILAALTQWTSVRWLAAIATGLIVFQAVVIVSPTPGEVQYKTGDRISQQLLWGNPTTVMRRLEQWDWSPLHEIARQHQLNNPLVSYLGNEGSLNPPQIAFPWVKANEEVRVNWLWNHVNGDLEWDRAMEAIAASDLVITAPTLKGSAPDRSDIDNQHNAELVQRLQQNPQFSAPIPLKMGRFEPIEVVVFVRKSGQASEVPDSVKPLDIY